MTTKKILPKHLKPYFKVVHDKQGCFILCVLYNKMKKSFSAGVALVHRNDQSTIDWQLGKNVALRRAKDGKNNIIKRFPNMTFTDKDGNIHFQNISPVTQCLNLNVMKHWQNAQKELRAFYECVKEQVPLDISLVGNPQSHMVMPLKSKV